MARQKGNKSHKRPKHGQGPEQQDWTFRAKTVRPPQEVAPHEDCPSSENVLNFVLYNKRIRTEQPKPNVEPAFNFLALPGELRNIVYRFSLRCHRPITPGGSEAHSLRLQIDKRDSVTVNLLRTCRQINAEGSHIFYGDNAFELLHEYTQPSIVALMFPASIDWLKELKIEIPIIYCHLYVHKAALNYLLLPSGKRTIGTGVCRTDFLLNKLIQFHLDAICNASNLRKLVMVIEPKWHLSHQARLDRRQLPPDPRGEIRGYLNIPDVLEDLATLMKYKPNLQVTVVRLHHPNQPVPDLKIHERVLKMLEQRLGIWDVREATLFVNEKKKRRHWTMPPVDVTKDPSDLLESLQALFGQVP